MKEARTDEELMAAYQAGDHRAFEELYRRYAPRVFGYLRLRSADASERDELFQATFLKLHSYRSSYDRGLPFAPWLFTICRSVVIDASRAPAASRSASAQPEEVTELASPAPSAEEQLAAAGDGSSAVAMLGALGREQAEATRLRYLDELSFEEIARRLGVTPETVRQRVSRAIRQLRRRLV